MKVVPKAPSSGAPASLAVPNRTSITLNTGLSKDPSIAKLDAIKARFSGKEEAPKNKQGEAIPPQPTSVKAPVEPNPAQGSVNIEKPASGVANDKAEDSQLQVLARQQRAVRKAQQELKAAQEAWKQEQAKYIPKDLLTSDPFKALAEVGLTQDRLVELQLNQASPLSETDSLKQEIAELKKQLAGVDEKFTTRDKQAYDNAVQTIKRDTELLVNSDPTFETIKALGSEGTNEVVELIKKQFALDGTILDVEDAAKQIEELATERETKRLERMLQLSKYKQKLAPQAPAPSVSEDSELKQSTSSQTPTTITNNMGVSRPLSAREKAILAFEQAAKRKTI